jgi:Zn-finger nucleic acid-binding protein
MATPTNAGTLKCPMCGAAAPVQATACEHCGARLATVACPSCFGMIFRGAKYCSLCGARADREEDSDSARRPCPRCRMQMEVTKLGEVSLRECPKCQGIWTDTQTLEQICTDRNKQVAVQGMPGAHELSEIGSAGVEQNIRYVPCPVCNALMNRINFARFSNVVVDVCKTHGTWFDRDELRRVVEFIRAGGLDKARAREIAEMEERRRQLKAETVADAWDTRQSRSASNNYDESDFSGAISVVGSLLRMFRR